MDPLIKDLFSIVLKYVPLFQLFDMEKIYPKGMKYFLGKLSIGDKIRGLQRLSCGSSYTMYISQEGHLCASGRNISGQLGLGDNKERDVFEKVSESVVAVSCEHSYTMYITQEGCLYASEWNDIGELGLGDNKTRNVFEKESTT
jgi:alpha-tubulin suppressor-like RCC1 family protein